MRILERSCKLEAVRRHHPVVVVRRGDERGWVRGSRFEIVKRRIGVQGLELFGVLRGAVVRRPGPPDRELVESQHVHHPDGRQAGCEQVGPLRHARPDQQPAVAAAVDGKFFLGGVLLVDQPLRRSDEVIKDILLVQLLAGIMPFLAVLPTAAKVSHGVDAAHLHPHDVLGAEPGRNGNVEPSVAVQQRGVTPVQGDTLLVRDEHRHLGAVLAPVEHLPGDEVGGVEIDFRPAKNRALARLDVVTKDHSRNGETGIGVESLGIVGLSSEPAGRTHAGKLNRSHESATRVKHLDPRNGVLEVRRNEPAADKAYRSERVRTLGYDFFPVIPFGPGDVDRDHAVARGVQIGAKPEDRAVMSDEAIGGFKLSNQFDDLGAFVLQILVKHQLLASGSLPDGDDQVPTVVGHRAVKPPFFFVGAVANEHVVRLRGAQAVVKKLLIIVQSLKRGVFVRLIVPAVEEALAVFGPGRAGKLDPLEVIVEIRAGGDVAHLPFLPVAAGGRQPVGEQLAVVGGLPAAKRNRPIFRQLVRVEKYGGSAVQGRHGVQHVLVLQAVILLEEVSAPLLVVQRVFLIVPDFGQTLLDGGALGDLFQVTEGKPVLGFDPFPRLRRVRILKPAVGIGHFGFVIKVNLIPLAGFGVGQRFVRACRNHRKRTKSQARKDCDRNQPTCAMMTVVPRYHGSDPFNPFPTNAAPCR